MVGFGSRLRGWKCFTAIVVGFLVTAALFVSAEDGADTDAQRTETDDLPSILSSIRNFSWRKGRLGYTHVWPVKTLFSPFVPFVFWLPALMDFTLLICLDSLLFGL